MTPGQAAFEKWVELVPALATIFKQWAQLPDIAQAGWEDIAQAAIDQYKQQNVAVKNIQEPCDTCAGHGCPECRPV